MAIEKGNKQLVQLLLDAGADFNHIVQLNDKYNTNEKLLLTPMQFADRLKMSGIRHTIEEHQKRVQQSFEVALRHSLKDIQIKRAMSALHCYALWESQQLQVFFDYTPTVITERSLFVVAVAVAKIVPERQQVHTNFWGSCPVDWVRLNGEQIKPLAPDGECRFLFGCRPQPPEHNSDNQCQKIEIKLKQNHALSLNKLLVQVYLLQVRDTDLYRETRDAVLAAIN